MPMVLGHEGAGIVEQVGSAVTSVKPGDHVVINLAPFCGQCRDCTGGRIYRCLRRRGPSGTLYDGQTRLSKNGKPIYHYVNSATYAKHAIIHESSAIKIESEIPLDKACLVGCALPAGMGAALNTAQVEPGSNVLVIGCGGVGLNVIQGCRLAGAAKIIAVDILESKLQLAREFGATHLIDASMENTRKRVQELTENIGVDYAFEVIGRIDTIMDAYESICRGGKAVVVGIGPDGSHIPIPPRSLVSEKTLTGTQFGSTNAVRDFPTYLELYMLGKVKIDELITKYRPLEEINQAFTDLEQGKVIRTILRMD